ncbi:DUF2510 domain-containing protein [Nonomuraea typhae]|uniref:DUF2510 domain-containing protein n=1 Tax=Nonomuraea typhae TaxID=2603600 RepID=UPI0015E1FA79|nr:DUF2510 domain-containing protein [Nonomuraea typhae]
MTSQTPAGWYPDPYGSPQLRWWDGNQWTDATHAQEQAPPQPPQAPQPAPQDGTDWSAHPANPTLQYGTPLQGQGQYGQPSSGSTPNPTTPFAQPSFEQRPSYEQSTYGQPNPYEQQGSPQSGPQSTYGPPNPQDQLTQNAYGQQQPTAVYGQQPGQFGQWGGSLPPGPGGYGPPPKKGGPLPWILGGVGVLVVVALIVVAAVVVVNQTSGGTAAPPSTPPTSSEAPFPTETEDPGSPVPTAPGSPAPIPTELPGVEGGRITDTTAGLSFEIPQGWKVPQASQVNGTEPDRQNWSSAAEAVSHEKYDGKSNWIGNVYAGALNPLYPYQGTQSLGATANTVLATFAGYYQLPHTRKLVKNEAIKIGDKDAWVLQFELDFSKVAKEKGYKWKKENAAIVLMDRGTGERPTLLYVSVPDNLGTDVVNQVLSSLKPA